VVPALLRRRPGLRLRTGTPVLRPFQPVKSAVRLSDDGVVRSEPQGGEPWSGRRIAIEGPSGLPVALDGESAGDVPIEMRVSPRSLVVYTPLDLR